MNLSTQIKFFIIKILWVVTVKERNSRIESSTKFSKFRHNQPLLGQKKQTKEFVLLLPAEDVKHHSLNSKNFHIRALKSHALSVSLTHFDAILRSHADTSISHALALFWWVTHVVTKTRNQPKPPKTT